MATMDDGIEDMFPSEQRHDPVKNVISGAFQVPTQVQPKTSVNTPAPSTAPELPSGHMRLTLMFLGLAIATLLARWSQTPLGEKLREDLGLTLMFFFGLMVCGALSFINAVLTARESALYYDKPARHFIRF